MNKIAVVTTSICADRGGWVDAKYSWISTMLCCVTRLPCRAQRDDHRLDVRVRPSSRLWGANTAFEKAPPRLISAPARKLRLDRSSERPRIGLTACDEGSLNLTAIRRVGSLPRRKSLPTAAVGVVSGSGATVQATYRMAFPYGHFATGGIDDRIESTLPPVFRPKMVPRS